jgi:hypothetical protein
MNAKQRRQDRRLFKYEVRVKDYEMIYERYYEMFDWCVATFGNTRKMKKDIVCWREKFGHFGDCWQFSTEQGAALFALKWT